jgi:pilus assembly protein Flp/PilA
MTLLKRLGAAFDRSESREIPDPFEVVGNNRGQDLAEYALLIALIAIVVIAAVTLLGGNIQTVFENIADAFD